MARRAALQLADMRAVEEQDERVNLLGRGATPSMGVSERRGGMRVGDVDHLGRYATAADVAEHNRRVKLQRGGNSMYANSDVLLQGRVPKYKSGGSVNRALAFMEKYKADTGSYPSKGLTVAYLVDNYGATKSEAGKMESNATRLLRNPSERAAVEGMMELHRGSGTGGYKSGPYEGQGEALEGGFNAQDARRRREAAARAAAKVKRQIEHEQRQEMEKMKRELEAEKIVQMAAAKKGGHKGWAKGHAARKAFEQKMAADREQERREHAAQMAAKKGGYSVRRGSASSDELKGGIGPMLGMLASTLLPMIVGKLAGGARCECDDMTGGFNKDEQRRMRQTAQREMEKMRQQMKRERDQEMEKLRKSITGGKGRGRRTKRASNPVQRAMISAISKTGKVADTVGDAVDVYQNVKSIHDDVKGVVTGGGRAERAKIVKRVMNERGISMIEASKVVKSEGLY